MVTVLGNDAGIKLQLGAHLHGRDVVHLLGYLAVGSFKSPNSMALLEQDSAQAGCNP